PTMVRLLNKILLQSISYTNYLLTNIFINTGLSLSSKPSVTFTINPTIQEAEALNNWYYLIQDHLTLHLPLFITILISYFTNYFYRAINNKENLDKIFKEKSYMIFKPTTIPPAAHDVITIADIENLPEMVIQRNFFSFHDYYIHNYSLLY
ncbi:hypothetical protein TorRG33x02_350170, partial [Trema orientale]